MNELLERLLTRQSEKVEKRESLFKKRAAIIEEAKGENREDLNEKETKEFDEFSEEVRKLDAELEPLQARIKELQEEEERTKRVAQARKALGPLEERIQVGERRTYEKGNGQSYFADYIRANVLQNMDAQERLRRHAQDVKEAIEKRDLTRTDGAGGEFVPPLWLIDQAVDIARAGRPTANVVTRQDLPAGTDSINIPTVTTGTATAIQTADNAAVQETDLVTSSVAAPVRTVAGQQDVAIQLLDQSPINFDELIFRDLVADYNTRLDVQVLSGSGSSGQVTGIRNVTGINAVTYTDASPTVGELYAKLADAVNQIHTNRFLSPTVIIMHPRRWAWFLAALDTQNRPLVVPNANNPMNAMGTFNELGAENTVGSIMGLPVVVDPSIPTNLGAGVNEDVIIVMRASDSILWESSIRTRTLNDAGSATLTVRLQVYGYIAFTGARYNKSISTVGGTGLVAPTF